MQKVQDGFTEKLNGSERGEKCSTVKLEVRIGMVVAQNGSLMFEDLLLGKNRFYLMHLSHGYNTRRRELWDFAREKRVIGLDNSGVNGDWPLVRDKAAKNLPNPWPLQFNILCENMHPKSMKEGDIVVVMAGLDYVLGIGVVAGPHRYKREYRSENRFFDHIRPVEWILDYPFDERCKIPRVYGFNNTLSWVRKDHDQSSRWTLFSRLSFKSKESEKVLSSRQDDADNLRKLAHIQTELTKETTQRNRYRRSRELVYRLKQLYEYQCQLCSSRSISIPQIPMKNGTNYVEVHHIKGFNEVTDMGIDQETGDYLIDNFKNTITVCVFHHKLLHKHKNEFSYDPDEKIFISRDKRVRIPLALNKHL